MRKLLTSFVFGVFVALMLQVPLHAQTASSTPDDSNAAAGATSPKGQAPDDVTKKITDLVHAGKYAEAQQLTTGLRSAYPEDQRLIKAQAMLDKLLAAGSAKPAANGNPSSTNSVAAQSPAHSSAEQFTGMDKVDFSALTELVRQAQQTTDLPEQTRLLQQFMDQSGLFLQKHPEQMLLWQLRAVSAISLNAPLAGFEAAQKLLAAGAADSNDGNVLQLLAKLKLLGWLDQHQAEQLQRSVDNERRQQADAAKAELLKEEHDKYTFPAAHAHGFSYGYGHLTMNVDDAVYVAADETIRLSRNDIREMKVFCVGNGFCGFYFYPKDGRKFFFLMVTEAAVANRSIKGNVVLAPSVLGNAAVAKWKFVSIDKKTLGPPPAAQNTAPVIQPTPATAVPDEKSSVLNGNPVQREAPVAETEVQGSAPLNNPAPLAAASNTTILHVYRPHHFTAAMQKPSIYVDGKKITSIANAQAVRMILTSGKHNISVFKKYLENEFPINDLEMTAGNEYWVRVDISAGAWTPHLKLSIVPNEQALSESKRMEEVRIDELAMN